MAQRIAIRFRSRFIAVEVEKVSELETFLQEEGISSIQEELIDVIVNYSQLIKILKVLCIAKYEKFKGAKIKIILMFNYFFEKIGLLGKFSKEIVTEKLMGLTPNSVMEICLRKNTFFNFYWERYFSEEENHFYFYYDNRKFVEIDSLLREIQLTWLFREKEMLLSTIETLEVEENHFVKLMLECVFNEALKQYRIVLQSTPRSGSVD